MKTFRKLSVSFSLSIEHLNYLNGKCKELGISSSDYISMLLDDAKLNQQVLNEFIDKKIEVKF